MVKAYWAVVVEPWSVLVERVTQTVEVKLKLFQNKGGLCQQL